MTAVALGHIGMPMAQFGFGDQIAPPRQVWRRRSDTSSAFGAATVPEWEDYVVRRVGSLLKLEENWDGHGGRPVRFDTAVFAVSLLDGIMWPDTPYPEIVPLAYGGLQIEWHESGIDLEIEIVAPNEVYVSYADANTDETEEDLAIGANFSGLERFIKRLTDGKYLVAAE